MAIKLKSKDYAVILIAIFLYFLVAGKIPGFLGSSAPLGPQILLTSQEVQYNNQDIKIYFEISENNRSIHPQNISVVTSFNDNPLDIQFKEQGIGGDVIFSDIGMYSGVFRTSETGQLKIIVDATVSDQKITKLLVITVKNPTINIQASIPNTVFVGDSSPLSFSFTDQNGKSLDIDSVDFEISDPSETGIGESKFARKEILKKEQIGRYSTNFKFDLIGDYIFKVTPRKKNYESVPFIGSTTVFGKQRLPYGLLLFGTALAVLFLLIVRQLIFRGGLRRR